MNIYDSVGFDPPAPIALVIVKSKQSQVVIHDVPRLIDTGADVSLLPRSKVASLASPNDRRYELEAFDGTKSTAATIHVEVQLRGKSFRGQFLLIDTSYGVVGRNVLNDLIILFDVPSRTWTERQ